MYSYKKKEKNLAGFVKENLQEKMLLHVKYSTFFLKSTIMQSQSLEKTSKPE